LNNTADIMFGKEPGLNTNDDFLHRGCSLCGVHIL